MMINPVSANNHMVIPGIPHIVEAALYNPHSTEGVADISAAGCSMCQNRMYVDVSDDGGVSFQAPTRLTPSQAATAVPAHEGEHAARETARAHQEGRVVLHNSIRIFTATCPECGIQYVSGGETRTVTASVEGASQAPRGEYPHMGAHLDVSI